MNLRPSWPRLLAPLFAAPLLVACDQVDESEHVGAAASELRDAITIPTDELAAPADVYVLPAIFVPQDWAGFVPHPTIPGADLAGNRFSDDLGMKATSMAHARKNFSSHLQWARAKYESMLRKGGPSRGTFRIATWDEEDGVPKVHSAGDVVPWVFLSSRSEAQVAAGGKAGEAEELMDALGCLQQSCPFVFATAAMRGSSFTTGAYALNFGLNGGPGIVEFPFNTLRYSHLERDPDDCDPPASTTFLSTLLHELGHAFGLSHLKVYDIPSVPELHADLPDSPGLTCTTAEHHAAYCQLLYAQHPDVDRYAFRCSTSIMGYSQSNWTNGCVTKDADGICNFDSSLVGLVDWMIPGSMIPDDVRHLAINRRVFPDLRFDASADVAPWVGLQTYAGSAGIDVPGHVAFHATSHDSTPGSNPDMAFGHTSNAIVPITDAYSRKKMWRSKDVGAGGWATITVALPTDVLLHRVRVYTGDDGGTDKATDFAVEKAPLLNPPVECESEDLGSSSHGEATVSSAGACAFATRNHRIRFKAGSSGVVSVRGIRLFSLSDGELFPPREPTATTAYGEEYGSSVMNVVGSEQIIHGGDTPYQSWRHWHSAGVSPGQWVSLDVTFPDEVALGKVGVYTGYGSGTHRAVKVQVERKLDGVFQYVDQDPIVYGDGDVTWAGAKTGTTWRIAFQTASSGQGYVVVRGLRFYGVSGDELFPVRVAP